jgi:hypothetical protein
VTVHAACAHDGNPEIHWTHRGQRLEPRELTVRPAFAISCGPWPQTVGHHPVRPRGSHALRSEAKTSANDVVTRRLLIGHLGLHLDHLADESRFRSAARGMQSRQGIRNRLINAVGRPNPGELSSEFQRDRGAVSTSNRGRLAGISGKSTCRPGVAPEFSGT